MTFFVHAVVSLSALAASVAADPPSSFTVESIDFEEPSYAQSNYKATVTVIGDADTRVECIRQEAAGTQFGDGFSECNKLDSSPNGISMRISQFSGLYSFSLDFVEQYEGGTYSGSTPLIVSNGSASSTPGYICDAAINPDEIDPVYNASCSLASPYTVSAPVTDAVSCFASLYFPVLETTRWETGWDDNLYVTGNISALGNWDYLEMLGGSPDYTASYPLWNGTAISITPGEYAEGTGFEYKYVLWRGDGKIIWEDGENRVWTAPSGFWSSCGSATVGQNPDVFHNDTAAS